MSAALAAPKVAITGLAASHDIKREGSRLCFSDHYHYGSSAGLANKKKAEAEAISSWASFVDFEYGPTWANFKKASSKGMNCSQSTSGWGCELSARPCI
ncbi:MAG: hypothetical protein CTY31_13010 [Hyphomicrobium sp.]|nr:MAG: hypothetical protein CTY39_09770 [Hyphomicrobium sp.]PPC98534.1 MAG: hypothetical protein CTY31_13010 [Hyphomicrobium sp.]